MQHELERQILKAQKAKDELIENLQWNVMSITRDAAQEDSKNLENYPMKALGEAVRYACKYANINFKPIVGWIFRIWLRSMTRAEVTHFWKQYDLPYQIRTK